MLYNYRKEYFVSKSNKILDDLYDGLTTYDDEYLSEQMKQMIKLGFRKAEDFTTYYSIDGNKQIMKFGHYSNFYATLSDFKKVFDNNITEYSQENSDNLHKLIKRLYANNKFDKKLVTPLFQIHKELENYITN